MFTKRVPVLVPRISLTLMPVFSFGDNLLSIDNLLSLPFSYSPCSTPTLLRGVRGAYLSVYIQHVRSALSLTHPEQCLCLL
ncbi:hypothetical protein BC826DRAFT_1070027 [Russula brevipes]|nr:hypothetical protein BC826DRAFT_1070027 [Russula brevipes]